MIRSFRDAKTETLFNDQDVPRFRSFERVARRKLLYLHRARHLEDLRVPPGNRLEALKGGSIVSESTINGASAFTGKMEMPIMLK